MAFLVQDDNGSVAGANSYMSVADYKSYHSDRNNSRVADSLDTDAEIQAALIKATDYIDSRYVFIGERRSNQQTTDWPRFDAEDREEYLITGIPHQVKESCAELAYAELESPGSLFPNVPTDSSGQTVKRSRKKLDVLEEETEFFGDNPNEAIRPPIFYTADWRLKRSGLTINNRTISRG